MVSNPKTKLIGDADFFYHTCLPNNNSLDLLKQMSNRVILTPNAVEFDRLCNKL